MRRLAAAAVAVAAVALLGLLMPWDAGAQQAVDVAVTEVGWWSSNPVAVAQPAGGFQITAGPDGAAQSVAALRLSIAATKVDSLQVRLVESSAVGAEFGILRLCTTADPWVAANPGSLDSAPKPDCTVAAGLTRTTDGVWLGDATALAPNGGQVSLMVVPVYQPPTPVGPGMIVTISGGEFSATGANATTTTESGGGSSSGTSSTFDGGATDYFGPSVGGSFGIPDYGITADFGSVPPSPEQTATGDTTAPKDDFALRPVKSAGDPPPPWIRLLIIVPLCVGVGVGSVWARRALVV